MTDLDQLAKQVEEILKHVPQARLPEDPPAPTPDNPFPEEPSSEGV